MRSGLVFTLAVAGVFAGCTRETKVNVTGDKEKVLYTLGQMYARKIDNLRLTADEVDVMNAGTRDWLVNQKSEVNYDEQRMAVQKFIEGRMQEVAKVEKEKGTKYVQEFQTKGGKVTPSGLNYSITKPGDDKTKPGPADTVEVHYHGTFIDGRVFDSSVDRKEKATFPLDVVIKGWQEGLQLIGEGGEIRLVVPPDLGYGDMGSPPKIPGGSTLVFDITLFKVTKKQ